MWLQYTNHRHLE